MTRPHHLLQTTKVVSVTSKQYRKIIINQREKRVHRFDFLRDRFHRISLIYFNLVPVRAHLSMANDRVEILSTYHEHACIGEVREVDYPGSRVFLRTNFLAHIHRGEGRQSLPVRTVPHQNLGNILYNTSQTTHAASSARIHCTYRQGRILLLCHRRGEFLNSNLFIYRVLNSNDVVPYCLAK